MVRMKRHPDQPPPRERILQAARELFYRDGINAVSVDAIATAAATNKMTLYRHFSSKDELVAAYLSGLAAEGDALWDNARAAHPGDPDTQLRYLLKRASQFAAEESAGRGCALANAAIELAEPRHPARRVVEVHKRKQRERLVALGRASACRASGRPARAPGFTPSPASCSTRPPKGRPSKRSCGLIPQSRSARPQFDSHEEKKGLPTPPFP